ncbi:hypothetical protein HY489_01860 [Candidatus Woesearchaeota archaeon]|nr:hypothetical protein [Candidatus Woesearchaeota archaeon]
MVDIKQLERNLKDVLKSKELSPKVQNSLDSLQAKCQAFAQQFEDSVRKHVEAAGLIEVAEIGQLQHELKSVRVLLSKKRMLLNTCLQQTELHTTGNGSMQGVFGAKGVKNKLLGFLTAAKSSKSQLHSLSKDDVKSLCDELSALETSLRQIDKLVKDLEAKREQTVSVDIGGVKSLEKTLMAIAKNFLQSVLPVVQAQHVTDERLKKDLLAIAQEFVKDEKLAEKFEELLSQADWSKG